MDTVYDKLTSESPYDAVSNGINSSVMVYKDGKDNSLVGGERERLIKEEAVNRFYERLKEELSKTDPKTKEVTIDRTSIGNYAVTKDNDVIEKSTESFVDDMFKDAILGFTVDFIHFSSKTQLKVMNELLGSIIKFLKNHDKLSEYKHESVKNIPNYKDKSYAYLKNIIATNSGNETIEANFSSFEEFLRDSTNAFHLNDKEYITRYELRIREINKIINKNYDSYMKLLNEINDRYNDSNFSIQKYVDEVTSLSSSLRKDVKKLINTKSLCDNKDFFMLKLKYFTLSPIYFLAIEKKTNIDYGCFVEDAASAIKKEESDIPSIINSFCSLNNSFFCSLTCSKNTITELKDTVISKLPEVVVNNFSKEKKKTKLTSLIDEITLKEYDTVSTNFFKETEYFKENAHKTLVDVLEILRDLCKTCIENTNTMITVSKNLSKDIDEENKKALIKIFSSITAFNSSETAKALSSLYTQTVCDLYSKILLYNYTCESINHIDSIIQQSTGDK